jgi:hypothetical protein
MDAEKLHKVACSQGVDMVLLARLDSLGADASVGVGELSACLRRDERTEIIRELRRRARGRHVIELMSRAGIPVLVLKGMALGYWLYPSAVQRPATDIDLLVADVAIAKLAAKVLADHGYRVAGGGFEKATGFEIGLVNGGRGDYAIDLHWRLVNHAKLAGRVGFQALMDASRPLPELHTDARGLGRVHALLHALLHRIANAPHGNENRLIWLYDIHLLTIGMSVRDWEQFLDLCKSQGMGTPCLDGLKATRDRFKATIPAPVELTLARWASAENWDLETLKTQGGMDRAHLAGLPWGQKLVWLRRKLIPAPSFMRHRYETNGRLSLGLAYMGRWWFGVKRALGLD